MVAKRVLFPSSPAGVPVAKRLRRMETQIRSNRPEMKNYLHTASGSVGANAVTSSTVTNIAQGTAQSQRVGNKIRVWRVEARGNVAAPIDLLLVQNHTATGMSDASVSTSTQGGMIIAGNLNNLFTEWHHHCNTQENQPSFKFAKSFKKGMVVHFNGPAGTTGIQNELQMVLVNSTGAALTYGYSVRVWYTDN